MTGIKRIIILFILMLGVTLFHQLRADTVVLLHGYASASKVWYEAGVLQKLQQNNYPYHGDFYLQGNAFHLANVPTKVARENVVFTINLPDKMSIEMQAVVLGVFLKQIYESRKEKLTLIGFSAGGVVARAWLTSNYRLPTESLITIASPHLGTPVAAYAGYLSKTPIRMMTDFFTDIDLKKSQALLSQLETEKKGNYLFWLNRLPHPDLNYVSIIRANDSIIGRDHVVPVVSQDMNRVIGIQGRSATLYTQGDHEITAEDGDHILKLLHEYSD